eukprot:11606988-Alexandrium_andersonii.AAC.1
MSGRPRLRRLRLPLPSAEAAAALEGSTDSPRLSRSPGFVRPEIIVARTGTVVVTADTVASPTSPPL